MAESINHVVCTGNLTRDPELRSLPSGTSLCSLRLAVNGRIKDASTGEWGDKPNYFDVTVWGKQGESCARFLQKGSAVAIDGRLDWHEWTTAEGAKRQAVQIVAEKVQFIGGKGDGQGGSGGARSDVPVDERDFQTTAPAGNSALDDIPFLWDGPPSRDFGRVHTSR